METAIIGMAFRFPGADDCNTFWTNLIERKSSVTEVPVARWDWRALWGDPKLEVNRTFSKWGGFVDDADAFDHQFFGFLPKVVQSMDPQQRIMLEMAWNCMEDAGVAPSSLAGRNVAVVVGVFNHDYKELQERDEISIEAHHSTGTATAVIANRVSHFFDFRGPSVPIDTACSSSLNALHNAIQALEYDGCELALAGGINLMLTPTRHISFSKMGMLSPTGTCKTFDDTADGYVRGEGAGFLLLKPLQKAIADGDPIHGVIKGTAVNHCGGTYTLTYPSPRAQSEVIMAAHQRAAVPVDTVGFVELHGTGTPKGDPIEFEGLVRAFETLAERQGVSLSGPVCGLSSVKTNIGHLEAAAGLAGIVKVLLAMRHRRLPAFQNFTRLNSRIRMEGTPFYALDDSRPWLPSAPDVPLRAGISSFGFGGTNAHVVLEEAPAPRVGKSPRRRPSDAPVLVALSAKTADALRRRVSDLRDWLQADAGATPLIDISRTLLLGREALPVRFACVADGHAALIEALDTLLAAGTPAVASEAAQAAFRDDAGREALQALVAQSAKAKKAARGDALQTLAQAFLAGANPAWAPLFASAPGTMARLPGYPFARERFWIPASIEGAARETGGAARLHPLLHRNESTLTQLRFASTFDGSERFLSDHVVDDRRVLPGVACLEMVREAVCRALALPASAPVRVEDVVWQRPIEVLDRIVEIWVELAPADGVDAVASEAALRLDFRILDAEAPGAPSVHCRGRAVLGMEDEAALPDLDAIAAGCVRAHDADACYRAFDALGLHYGPSHRGIADLRLGEGQCLARVVLPETPGLADCIVHPGIADAALQSAVALVAGVDPVRADAPCLPFALDRLDILGTDPSGPRPREFLAWARFSPRSSSADRVPKIDVDLIARPGDAAGEGNDGIGQLRLAFRGLSIRPRVVEDILVAAATATAQAPQVPAALDDALYSPVWLEAALPPSATPVATPARVLLVGEGDGLDRLRAMLAASPRFAGTQFESLRLLPAEATEAGEGGMRAASLSDAEAQVAAWAARSAQPEAIVWCAPGAGDAASPQARLDAGARSVYALCKALLRGPKKLRIVHLAPAEAGGEATPDAIGLAGFYKTLSIEKPSFAGRVLQLPLDAAMPARVADELSADDKAIEVRYLDDRRETRRFAAAGSRLLPKVAATQRPPAAFRQGGAYLITGGMGALGLIVARHLCAHHGATVFLTGRSAPSDAQAPVLAELAALGGRAVYLACDVADRDDVRRALSEIRADLSAHGQSLRGVLHSAGVIEDNFLLRKPADAFARVVAPKMLGTVHLDLETRDDPLDLFVLFSSVTGVLGNVGQCDYAFGNAFEDAFAAHRDRLTASGGRSGKAVSINWPYWKDGGMRLSDKEEEALRRGFGIVPLSTAHGIEALEFAIAQPQPQVAVMPVGDLAKVHAVLGVVAGNANAPAMQDHAVPAAGVGGAADDPSAWHPAVSRHLSALFAKELGIPDEFESDRTFKEYGFDSVVMIDLIASLEKTFGTLPKTLFFEYQTLRDLTAYFVESHADVARGIAAPAVRPSTGIASPATTTMAAPSVPRRAAYAAARPAASTAQVAREDDPIAIVGLAGRYPQAEDLQGFWDNLCAGRDCIETIPSDRPDIANKFIFQPGKPVLSRSYSQWGSFLREVDRFDPLFFNISPKEAENMNPNERLMMEIAMHAIEDAGYTPDTLAAPRGVHENPVGVYIGMMWGDYQLHGVDRPRDEWAAPFGYYWAVPNRISHFFNFSGPSLAIDSACSSSLSAIHLACMAIRTGEIDVALAGAVNLSLHANKYNMLADMRFLSTDGRCRAFGAGGDGYVPGEGVGAVLLKPLSKAVADGDHIYAIVRGTSLNHGGKTSGFTVPSPKRQAALIQDALIGAGVDARDISYVEAHGTGTSLGDPIEISGLIKAFAQTDRQYCAIGSAKSNLGHLEAAAGVAGLTKVLLQMQHGQLVPSIHSEVLNPYIDFAQSPFRVQRTLEAWQRPVVERDGVSTELPRIAGISSFGAGGANGHLIVEEHIPAGRTALSASGPWLFPLSARREDALCAMASRLADRLASDPTIDLADAAYTLQVGRVPLEFRTAIVASDRATVVAALRACAARGAADGMWSGHRDGARRDAAVATRVAEATPCVADWVAAKALPSLARAWTDGVAVDWRGLHAGQDRRRLSLPGYVFQRQRYWLPEPSSMMMDQAAALHPLIDTNVSTLDEQTFAKTFRPEAFYLADHRLGGNRILPGVAYLELAIQAASLSAPGRRPVSIEDVRWMRPVVVDDAPVDTRIGLLPDPDGIAFALYAPEDAQRRPFAEGLVRTEEASAPPRAAEEVIDLAAVANRCAAIGQDEIDAAFAAMGFAFGPAFRCMTRLHHGADEALAHVLMTSIPGVRFEDYVLHPALMDCAIRACLGVGGLVASADAIRVPVRMRRIALVAPLGEEVHAYAARARQVPRDAQADETHFDIRLCDAQGRVLVRIEGLTVRPAPQLALAARRVARSVAAPAPSASPAPRAPVALPAAVATATAVPAVDASSRVAAVVARLSELLSVVTKLPVEQIDVHAPLENYGIDSTMVLALNEQLSNEYGDVPKTLFYEYQELHGVAEYIAEHHAASVGAAVPSPVAPAAPGVPVPVAPVVAPVASGSLLTPREAVAHHLVTLVGQVTKLQASEIEITAPLENYGIDSTMIVALNERLAETFGDVPKTLFFEYQDLDSLSEYFVEQYPEQSRSLADAVVSPGTPAPAPAQPAVVIPAPAEHATAVPAPVAVATMSSVAAPVDAEALAARLRAAFGPAAAACGARTPLSQWPFDPVLLPRVMHVLSRDFDGLTPEDPYSHADIATWARRLHWRDGRAPQSPMHASSETATSAITVRREPLGRFSRRVAAGVPAVAHDDIAIVGLSGRYPGADDLDGFWRNLMQGRDCITEIPESRWNYRDYFHPDRNHRGTVYSKWGGFIDGVDEFDADFFNMSARAAELVDPQERLFLQTAWECIESAGYTRQALRSQTVGVFVGVMWANYSLFDVSDEQILDGRPCPPLSSIANRVSYFMNLSGPSLSLDTMCSSSLTAMHLAIQAIRNGECKMAIAGGVNLILHPYKYQVLSGGQFLSTDGRCRAFGAGGDGYVPGEGVGAVMLKPLSKAIEDGDHVHGVIRASALNHGGKTNGYTVPNQLSQSAVIGTALRAADWDPRTIDYVEAHGTGTSLGDPIEIAGLVRAYDVAVRERDPDGTLPVHGCRIGSVKSNVGHLESAAGVVGLTKILLQMRHGLIAPSLHSATLNPNIDFARSPFEVVRSAQAWDAPADGSRPRRAALSSFGAGGSNAHLLIEEFRAPLAPAHVGPMPTPVLFVLSSDGEERLSLLVGRMLDFLRTRRDMGAAALRDLAYTSQIGREAMDERLVAVVHTVDELITALERHHDGASSANLQRGTVRQQHDKLESILNEGEKDALVRSILQDKRWMQLARAWVSFLDMDWARYRDALFPVSDTLPPPRRMPFPTMPFLTRRHWIEERQRGNSLPVLHPLIDRNVSTMARQRYEKRFTGQEFYLRDHIVRTDRTAADAASPESGRMILPGAAYLEMARAVGGFAVGDEWCVSHIRNLMWIQPFEIVSGPDSLAIDLSQAEDALGFDIVSVADGSLCVQGELELRHRDDVVADEWLDLNDIRSRGRLLEADRTTIYAGFREMGFEFGESFQVTSARYRTQEGALCQLDLPASLKTGLDGFGLHPSLLDGILRSGLAITDEFPINANIPHVPFALDALEFRHPLPQTCYAYVTPRRIDDAIAAPYGATGMRKYDIVVANVDGLVLARLHGFSARPLVKETPVESRALQYYDYAWRDAPIVPVAASSIAAPLDAHTLVLCDAPALVDALVAVQGDEQVVAVSPGTEFEALGHHRYRLDPLVPAQWDALFERLRAGGGLPGRIVHALAVDADAATGRAPPALDDAEAPRALRAGIDSLRHLFVALERIEPGRRLRCVYAYPAREDAAQPHHDAVSGYARSLLTVNHRFELGTLQAAFDSAQGWADAILAELSRDGGNGAEIAYRDGVRQQRFPEPTALEALRTAQATEQLPLRHEGVYLITGGAGKLGLLVARDLAQRCKARLVLTGRSTMPGAVQQEAIAAIAELAADVRYLRADIADAEGVAALVDEIVALHGRLDGIVHCAGVAGDQPITAIDEAAFDAMLSPKLDGLVLLDRATATMPLEFVVAFSSVSALIGDLGAGAYAVGNRFMDSYALWRERQRRAGRRHGRTLSINWPLWSEGGMSLADGDSSVFGFSGIQALTSDEGLQVLEALRDTDRAQVFVAVGDPDRIARVLRLPSARNAMAALSAPVAPAVPSTSAPPQPVALPMLAPPAGVSAPLAPRPAPPVGGRTRAPVDALQGEAERFVKERLAQILKTSAQSLDSERTFEQFGMESVALLELHNLLRKSFDSLPKTALFEFDTPGRLAHYLTLHHLEALRALLGPLDESPAQPAALQAVAHVEVLPVSIPGRTLPPARARALPSPARGGSPNADNDAIAIIGMGGEFPGAPGLNAFWEVIQAGKDCIVEVPADRDFAGTLAAGIGMGDANGTRVRIPARGGFVGDVHLFDPVLFRMTRREAEKADPQLRVLLRSTWRALEDAAYTADSLRAASVGVFVGSMNEDFTWVMSELHARAGDYIGPGSVASELANRISFLFDFRGPSFTVSTACSSSLTAVHLARQSILSGECDVALAAGVNLNLHAANYQMLQDMKVLSPDGVERTFDDRASGLVPGEGAGVVMLKRLDAALRDGDRIHGVLRASAISHSGTGAGQFMPNIRLLEQTAAQALEASGLEAEDIGYIESHGTGTELGDPIELKALSNVLRRSTDQVGFCAIGTRANFGHMEAASGIGAMIKVLLGMRHGKLAPCINLRNVNRNFDADSSPFTFPTTAREWSRNRRGTLAAGVNSFGMGGSNAFIVLESAPSQSPSPETGGVLVLSARSADALQAYLAAVVEAVDGEARTAAFGDLAYTSQVGRVAFDNRLAIVAPGREEFLARARRHLDGQRAVEGVFSGRSDAEPLPDLLSGDEGRAFVDALARNGQYDKLAALWVRGCAVEWSVLHAGVERRRVPFPGMPFELVDCSHRRLAVGLPSVAAAPTTMPMPKTVEAPVEGAGWFTLQFESPSVRQVLVGLHADGDVETPRVPQSETYWRDTLIEQPGTVSQCLPALLNQESAGDAPLRQVSEQLDTELVCLLQSATRRHHVDLQTMIAAAWAILVNRHTRAPSSQFGVLGAFLAVRDPADVGEASAPPRLLPVRVSTVGRHKVGDWLAQLQDDLIRKHAFHSAPLEAIARWVGADDLFDSVVVFETFAASISASGDRDVGAGREHLASDILSGPMSPRMELVVSMYEDGVELRLLYRSQSEDYNRASLLLEQLIVLLQGMAEHPDRNLGALSMRTRRDDRQGFWKAIESAVN